VSSFSALTQLGHLTFKNPSLTYNVFGGTLNLTQSIKSVEHHCAVILGKLFTPLCLCHQAV